MVFTVQFSKCTSEIKIWMQMCLFMVWKWMKLRVSQAANESEIQMKRSDDLLIWFLKSCEENLRSWRVRTDTEHRWTMDWWQRIACHWTSTSSIPCTETFNKVTFLVGWGRNHDYWELFFAKIMRAKKPWPVPLFCRNCWCKANFSTNFFGRRPKRDLCSQQCHWRGHSKRAETECRAASTGRRRVELTWNRWMQI